MMDYRQQFPGAGFPGGPGFPGFGNIERRLDRIERRLERQERQIQQLDRRVTRLERRFGFASAASPYDQFYS